MLHTRRRILRDTSRLILGAAATSSFPNLLCSQPNDVWIQGVRIFFIGTWLFCKDPQTTSGLLAITVDGGMGHLFPYGAWKPLGINLNPGLAPNPAPAHGPRKSYDVMVTGTTSPALSLGALFSDAQKNCDFNYIPTDLPLNFTAGDIRVISIPLPTKLLVAGILPNGATITTDQQLLGSGRAAVAHVFDYQGASALTFMGGTTNASTQSGANFHFHTVSSSCAYHGPMMFKALINKVLGNYNIKLNATESTSPPILGTCVPAGFDINELDPPTPGPCIQHKAEKESHTKSYVDRTGLTHTTASCAGGSLGVGG
jgi:hypothetical protein